MGVATACEACAPHLLFHPRAPPNQSFGVTTVREFLLTACNIVATIILSLTVGFALSWLVLR